MKVSFFKCQTVGQKIQDQRVPALKEIILVCSGLGLGLIILYNHAFLNNYWLYDDPFILRYAAVYSFREYMFIPEIWQIFSSAHFTPMVVASYALDYNWFGLEPQWFYLRSLFSLGILALLLYILLRLYVPWWAAFLGISFLVLSRPFAAGTEIIMFRHYIEGGIWACASFLLFILALRNKNFYLGIISALFSVLAMLSKEVYIPLVMLLVFVPEQRIQQRLKMIVLFIPGLLLYFVWRYLMLGSLVGGFSGSLLSESAQPVYQIASQNFYYLGTAILGPASAGSIPEYGLLSVLILILSIEFYKKNYSLVVFVAACLTGLCLPLVPISDYLTTSLIMDLRFAFVAAVVFSAFTALALSRIIILGHNFHLESNAKHCFLLPGVIIVSIFFLTWAGRENLNWLNSHRSRVIQPLSVEGRFLENHSRPAILIRSSYLLGTHYYSNLEYFLNRNRNIPPPLAVANGYGLLSVFPEQTDDQLLFFKYDHDTQKIIDVTTEITAQRSDLMARTTDNSFEVDFQVRQGYFELDLRTDQEDMGRFFILLGYHSGIYSDAFTLAPGNQISIRGNLFSGLEGYFRFGWESSQGRINLSPERWVSFNDSVHIRWTANQHG